MKKVVCLIAVLLFWAGCSSQHKTENKTAGTSNKPDNTAAKTANISNVAVNSPVAAQNYHPGEKIENPTEISFEADTLPPGWRWLDPDNKYNPTNYSTKSGVLHI